MWTIDLEEREEVIVPWHHCHSTTPLEQDSDLIILHATVKGDDLGGSSGVIVDRRLDRHLRHDID